MMRFLRLLAIFLLPLFSLAAPAAAESWRIVSEDEFPPYNFNHDSRRAGLDVEIIDAVLRKIGVEPDQKGLPWNRVVKELDGDETDIAFQFVGKPERFEKYNMAGPHRVGVTIFAVRADSGLTFDSLADLKGRTVGTVSNFSYTPEFDSADFFTKDPAVDNTLNLRKLAAGRVDLVIGDRDTLAYLAKREGLSAKIKFLPKALAEVPRYIAFPKSRTEKAERFRQGLEALKADGTIDAIMKKWSAL